MSSIKERTLKTLNENMIVNFNKYDGSYNISFHRFILPITFDNILKRHKMVLTILYDNDKNSVCDFKLESVSDDTYDILNKSNSILNFIKGYFKICVNISILYNNNRGIKSTDYISQDEAILHCKEISDKYTEDYFMNNANYIINHKR